MNVEFSGDELELFKGMLQECLKGKRDNIDYWNSRRGKVGSLTKPLVIPSLIKDLLKDCRVLCRLLDKLDVEKQEGINVG